MPNEQFDKLKNPLERMMRSQLRDQVEHSRAQHMLDLERNHRYWKGEHYQIETLNGNRVEVLSSGQFRAKSGAAADTGVNDYVLNFIRGDGRFLVGILGRMPNTTAVADSEDEAATERARKADKIIRMLWPHWNVEIVHAEAVRMHWLDGTVFFHTPFVVDASLYGQTKVPQYEDQPVQAAPGFYSCWQCGEQTEETNAGRGCRRCGMPLNDIDYTPPVYQMEPVEVEPLTFPNGSVELHAYTARHVTIPYRARSLASCGWLQLEYEESPSVIMTAHPEVADNLSAYRAPSHSNAYSDSAADRQARIAANSYRNYGDLWNSTDWLYTRLWIQPSLYYQLAMEEDSGNPRPMAEKLTAEFPDGIKAVYVNGSLVKVTNERLTDVWTECKPSVNETVMTEALCAPMIPLNDLVNDGFNIGVQTAQKANSINLFNPNVINPQYFKKARGGVPDWIPAMAGLSGDLRGAVHTTTANELRPAVLEMMRSARSAGQEIVHITPPLTGMDSREKTLGESEMNRNQALLPHNTQWAYLRQGWSEAFSKAIVQFAKYTTGKLYFRSHTSLPPPQLEIDDIEDLLNGGWHAECDQSIPLTWGQRRAQMFQLLERGPEMMQMLQLGNPQNLKTLYEIIGNEDFKITGLELHRKVMYDIGELVKGSPQQSPDGRLIPSIPPDDFSMDHAYWVQAAKDWMNDVDLGVREKRTHPAGYENVLARAMAELEIVNLINAQAAPPPEGGGEGAAPGKPGAEPSSGNQISSPPPNGMPLLGPAEEPTETPEEVSAMALEGV